MPEKKGRLKKRIPYVKLHPDAIVPCRKSTGAACSDFHSVEDVTIAPGRTRAVKSGIAVKLPEGFELAARSRSGLFINQNVLCVGTIDDDYTGEIKILLLNFGQEEFKVTQGMRVAQFKLSRFYVQDYVESEELEETERGAKGIGSTGV